MMPLQIFICAIFCLSSALTIAIDVQELDNQILVTGEVTLPDCKLKEYSKWDKLMTMLENTHMRQNMLLQYVEEVKVELQTVKEDLGQLEETTKGSCSECLKSITTDFSNLLDSKCPSDNTLNDTNEEKSIVQTLNIADKLQQIENLLKKREEADQNESKCRDKVQIKSDGVDTQGEEGDQNESESRDKGQSKGNGVDTQGEDADQNESKSRDKGQSKSNADDTQGEEADQNESESRDKGQSKSNAVDMQKLAELTDLFLKTQSWIDQRQLPSGCEAGILFPMRSPKIYASVHPAEMSLQAFTLCVWTKVTEALDKTIVISYGTKRNPYEIQLYLNHDSPVLVVGGDKNKISANNTLQQGEWSHMCATWNSDDGKATLWVNGEIKIVTYELAQGHVIPDKGIFQLGQEKNGCCVGGGFDESISFSGKITGFNLWNSVLRDEDIVNTVGESGCNIRGNVIGWGTTEIQPHGGAQYIY